MCARWLSSFDNFIADMGPRPARLTLERKDVNGNYCPSNCIWASYEAQRNNARSNHVIGFGGLRLNITQWSKRTGIARHVLYQRINRFGWTAERALTTPVQKRKVR